MHRPTEFYGPLVFCHSSVATSASIISADVSTVELKPAYISANKHALHHSLNKHLQVAVGIT
uniref:Uncharacterized protein n=1 Tax=Ulva partita TaxID=1605170 RepID=A0A1C9ZPK9_9CHLO|nr:hypothetical protein [Ulva partita]